MTDKPVLSPQERLDARLQWSMSTEQGRATMWFIMLDLGYLFSQSDAGEATHTSARNAGRRDVALELMEHLKRAAPLQYRLMLQERLEVNPDQPPEARRQQ